MENRIVINADDYGRSHEINAAIKEAFEKGLITDTSIMTTCQNGLRDLLDNDGLSVLNGSAGCHLCLTLGRPLTHEMNKTPFVNEQGEFFEFDSRKIEYDDDLRAIVYYELMAQIESVRKLGIHVTHLDSHQHIHFDLELLPIFVRVCRESGVPFLRIPSNRKGLRLKSRLAVFMKILYIRSRHIKTVDFFGPPFAIRDSIKSSGTTVELMCHPMYDSNHRIVNKVRVNAVDDCVSLEKDVEYFSSWTKIGFNDMVL